MPLFKVYMVKSQVLGMIDSIWKTKFDAERKAETLNVSKTPRDNDIINLNWIVEEREVL